MKRVRSKNQRIISSISSSFLSKRKRKRTSLRNVEKVKLYKNKYIIIKKKKNLGEIDVEKEGLFGVRDLDAIPLDGRRIRDVDIVNSLSDALHSLIVS